MFLTCIKGAEPSDSQNLQLADYFNIWEAAKQNQDPSYFSIAMFFIKAVVLALMLTTVASSYDDLEELLRGDEIIISYMHLYTCALTWKFWFLAQRERVKSIIAEAHAKTAKDSQPLKDAGIQG